MTRVSFMLCLSVAVCDACVVRVGVTLILCVSLFQAWLGHVDILSFVVSSVFRVSLLVVFVCACIQHSWFLVVSMIG